MHLEPQKRKKRLTSLPLLSRRPPPVLTVVVVVEHSVRIGPSYLLVETYYTSHEAIQCQCAGAVRGLRPLYGASILSPVSNLSELILSKE